MACFLLIPGAGTRGSAYAQTADRLRALGHEAICVDVPCDEEDAGLPEYVAAARAAAGQRRALIVVGQSLGAFTAVALTAEVDVARLVLLCPMIPAPRESAGDWWANTGHDEAIAELIARVGPMRDWDLDTLNDVFLPDASPETLVAAERHLTEQTGAIFEAPLPLSAWPEIPTHVLIGSEDRFFPPDFQRRVARERLGIEPDTIDAGHVPMISRPAELAERLAAYAN